MTTPPQDDLTAERAAVQYTMNDLFRMAMDGKVNIVEDKFVYASALQQTRRAALLEARKAVVSEYLQDPVEDDPGDIAYDHAIRDAVEAIDRLAQEG